MVAPPGLALRRRTAALFTCGFLVLWTCVLSNTWEAANVQISIPLAANGFRQNSAEHDVIMTSGFDAVTDGDEIPVAIVDECDSGALLQIQLLLDTCAGCIGGPGICDSSCCVGQIPSRQDVVCQDECCLRGGGKEGSNKIAAIIFNDLIVSRSAATCSVSIGSNPDCGEVCAIAFNEQGLARCKGGKVRVYGTAETPSLYAECIDGERPAPGSDVDDDAGVGDSDGEDSPKEEPSEGEPAAETEPKADEDDEEKDVSNFDGPVGAAACFPAAAVIELESGEVIRMDQLEIGHRVLVAPGTYSDVIMFTHKTASRAYEFVELTTESGARLRVSAGHYLYVNGALLVSGSVAVGDTVVRASGVSETVVGVTRVLDDGLYNPQTLHGAIVVNGIQASCYTQAIAPAAAHVALRAAGLAYTAIGVSTTAFESGFDALAGIFPGRLALGG